MDFGIIMSGSQYYSYFLDAFRFSKPSKLKLFSIFHQRFVNYQGTRTYQNCSATRRQLGYELCYLPEPLKNGRFYPHRRRCPTEDNSAACRLVTGTPVNVGWVLRYSCKLGFTTNTSHIASICLNRKGDSAGWFPTLPVCQGLYGC